MDAKTNAPMIAITDAQSLARAGEILLRGGVIAFPTETVYGLGVLYGNVAAEQRLRALKGRDAAKPFQLLVPDVAAAEKLVSLTPTARRVLTAFWPGALTVVLPCLNAPEKTLGLRAPDNHWLQTLLRTLPTGITATSANLAGEVPARNAQEAAAAIGQRVDLLLDGGESTIGQASTVISLINDKLQIFRAGSISESDLRQVMDA